MRPFKTVFFISCGPLKKFVEVHEHEGSSSPLLKTYELNLTENNSIKACLNEDDLYQCIYINAIGFGFQAVIDVPITMGGTEP